MKTTDELPEKFTQAQAREYSEGSWPFGNHAPSGGSETHAEKGTRSVPIPGGEQISKAELAAYGNREDRCYNNAGQAEMPPVWNPISMPLPRESSGGSWSTAGAGGGNEPHPTPVTEWKGGSKPEKPA